MGRSADMNPILVILFIFIGLTLGGVVGGILSIPLAGTVMILIRRLVIEPKREEVAAQSVTKGGILLAPAEAKLDATMKPS
jgi:predicted PurR-regulated permease PerM